MFLEKKRTSGERAEGCFLFFVLFCTHCEVWGEFVKVVTEGQMVEEEMGM